jgi:hypothetical protein
MALFGVPMPPASVLWLGGGDVSRLPFHGVVMVL